MIRRILLSFESCLDGMNLLLKEGAKCASCTLIIYLRKAGRGRILVKKTSSVNLCQQHQAQIIECDQFLHAYLTVQELRDFL